MQGQLSESVQTLKEYVRRVEYYAQNNFAETDKREDSRVEITIEESRRYLGEAGVLA
jgi:hypothetical protein